VEALLDQVRAALANEPAFTTQQLDALNQQCGRDHCNRRNRIIYQLQHFVAQQAVPMSAPSTTHQFKKDFSDPKKYGAPIEFEGKTIRVTAQSLSDEHVPLLKQYGYGHFLEDKPTPEKPAKKEKEDAKKD
jgi:hypothetical protein